MIKPTGSLMVRDFSLDKNLDIWVLKPGGCQAHHSASENRGALHKAGLTPAQL